MEVWMRKQWIEGEMTWWMDEGKNMRDVGQWQQEAVALGEPSVFVA